jgi:hypothetical protein
MKTGISGITMLSGNVLILEETIKSLSTICDEIVVGDLIVFPEDREVLYGYQSKYNLKIVTLPFDYIFDCGFASVLNLLAHDASNNTILYLNTSEVIEKDNGILDIVSSEYNCYYFDHATDPMRWYRFYDKRELQWSGRIHESLEALSGFDFRPFHKPAFRMADKEKDMQSAFKAYIFNSIKEICYFRNYMTLVELPENMRGATDPGWYAFALDNHESMKERLLAKGAMYQAFLDGDYEALMKSIYDNPEFEKEKFESNIGIEYQGDKKYLL